MPEKEFSSKLLVLFRPSIQPYLISEFKYDPAKLIAKLECPLLVVNGTTDVQVPVEDGKRLVEARKGTKHLIVVQMNHVLKHTDKTTVLEQLPLYTEAGNPLHPKLADELATFLKESLGGK